MIDDVLREVRAAGRRLLAIEFARVLPAAAAWGVAGNAGLLLAARHGVLVPPAVWLAPPLGALAAAAGWALVRRPGPVGAALALDAAAGLQERVTAALHAAALDSPAARAVVRDASAAIRPGAHRAIRFVRPPGRTLALPIAVSLALAVLALAGGATTASGGPAGERADPGHELVPESVRRAGAEDLRRRAYALERAARETKREELAELAEAMRKAADELRDRPMRRDEALARISSLEERAREALERRSPAGGAPPADARTRERLDQAAREIQSAAERARELAGEQAGDEASRRERQDELREIAERLAQAGQDAELPDDVQRNLEEAADRLTRCEGDAQSLADVAEALEGLEAASEADRRARGALEGELEDLYAMKGDLGEGAAGNGQGEGEGDGPGDGPGRGPGRGPSGRSDPDRPRDPTRIRGQLGPGDVIGALRHQARPGGEKPRTDWSEVHRQAAAEAAEAIDVQEIAPEDRAHVRDYFDSIGPREAKEAR